MKKSKKELRKEATKLANRIRRNIQVSHANSCTSDDFLRAVPALHAFTSLNVQLQLQESQDVQDSPSQSQSQSQTDVSASQECGASTKLVINFHKSLSEETQPQPQPQTQPKTQPQTQMLKQCLDLFQINMGDMYRDSSWGLNMDEKRQELTHDHARFLIATIDNNGDGDSSSIGNTDADAGIDIDTASSSSKEIMAFAHFRFDLNDDDNPTQEVLYLYEIQIQPIAQKNGLGRRMMQIMEIIAMNMKMRKVMLTVFKSNKSAMGFYRRLKYDVDEISPSMFGEEVDYEIMSKVVYKGED